MTKYLIITALAASTASASAQSPYIAKVWEYTPAPGQFTNTLPAWEEGDDAADMAQKAFDLIGGDAGNVISLGGWGGYIVFSFDHTLANKPGENDFTIDGNAFFSDDDTENGSSEPGIVMVSVDANGNGLPDDEWYELAGSEYNSESTTRNYSLTYHRPKSDHSPVAGNDPFITDAEYIKWTDNCGNEGYIMANMFHTQNYWPQWIDADQLTFTGTRLPDNAENLREEDSDNFVLRPFAWGYADNYPNNDRRTGFNLDWAVDAEGNPVKLDGIDFIKVYTGVNQNCGWLGETSTEVGRATDLHPDLAPVTSVNTIRERVAIHYDGATLTIDGCEGSLHSVSGTFMGHTRGGKLCINLDRGVYIVNTPAGSRKIMVK